MLGSLRPGGVRASGYQIGSTQDKQIRQLLRANEPNKARAEALSQRIVAANKTNADASRLRNMLTEQQWEAAAALLEEFPALLAHGSQP
eukprot:COSAG01_NODE_44617_length_417_cov_0.899371_1_plen_88_part_10